MHTDPRPRRAARRLSVTSESAGAHHSGARIRVIARRASPGRLHPATTGDVRRVLAQLGPEAIYGLRRVEVVPAPSAWAGGNQLVLGQLLVPGMVRLYDLPPSPWALLGVPGPALRERLMRCGAELITSPARTTVHWPHGGLRRLVLLEVLLHELGHHWVQHETRRPGRARRTRDHEHTAELRAARWRPLATRAVTPAMGV